MRITSRIRSQSLTISGLGAALTAAISCSPGRGGALGVRRGDGLLRIPDLLGAGRQGGLRGRLAAGARLDAGDPLDRRRRRPARRLGHVELDRDGRPGGAAAALAGLGFLRGRALRGRRGLALRLAVSSRPAFLGRGRVAGGGLGCAGRCRYAGSGRVDREPRTARRAGRRRGAGNGRCFAGSAGKARRDQLLHAAVADAALERRGGRDRPRGLRLRRPLRRRRGALYRLTDRRHPSSLSLAGASGGRLP